jgi:hypothetical protein
VRANASPMVVATLAAALLFAAACSSPQGTEPAENSLLGKDKRGNSDAGGRGAGKGAGRGGGTKNAGGDQGVSVTPAPGAASIPSAGSDGKGLTGAQRTETEVTSTGEDPRTASVVVTEPDADADKSGVAPGFADILSTRVEGDGPNVTVTIVFRGELPEKMPDDQTYMVAGFGMTGPKGQKQGYAFGASADQTGWTPYGGSEKGAEFEGEFSISGDTVVFSVPWRIIKGPRPFEWYAQTSWFKSVAGTTHYSMDVLPNDGPAKFPAD